MPKSTDKYELYRALDMVHDDAKKQFEHHNHQQWCAPLQGWSQEKHDAYHKKYAEQAKEVADYCFVRMMQINPD